jgi:hypothetical protein
MERIEEKEWEERFNWCGIRTRGALNRPEAEAWRK